MKSSLHLILIISLLEIPCTWTQHTSTSKSTLETNVNSSRGKNINSTATFSVLKKSTFRTTPASFSMKDSKRFPSNDVHPFDIHSKRHQLSVAKTSNSGPVSNPIYKIENHSKQLKDIVTMSSAWRTSTQREAKFLSMVTLPPTTNSPPAGNVLLDISSNSLETKGNLVTNPGQSLRGSIPSSNVRSQPASYLTSLSIKKQPQRQWNLNQQQKQWYPNQQKWQWNRQQRRRPQWYSMQYKNQWNPDEQQRQWNAYQQQRQWNPHENQRQWTQGQKQEWQQYNPTWPKPLPQKTFHQLWKPIPVVTQSFNQPWQRIPSSSRSWTQRWKQNPSSKQTWHQTGQQSPVYSESQQQPWSQGTVSRSSESNQPHSTGQSSSQNDKDYLYLVESIDKITASFEKFQVTLEKTIKTLNGLTGGA